MAKNTAPGKQISIFVSEETVTKAEKARASQKFPPSLSRLLSICLETGVNDEFESINKEEEEEEVKTKK